MTTVTTMTKMTFCKVFDRYNKIAKNIILTVFLTNATKTSKTIAVTKISKITFKKVFDSCHNLTKF